MQTRKILMFLMLPNRPPPENTKTNGLAGNLFQEAVARPPARGLRLCNGGLQPPAE
jgi:hypothetical protein